MTQVSPKGSLPYGWIVKASKHYPDRIYYFNTSTGVSTWELPELDPPRVLSEEEAKKEKDMEPKDVPNNRLNDGDSSPQILDTSLKSWTPPTAVVVPVIHKKGDETVLNSQVQTKKRKMENSEVDNPAKKSDVPLKPKKNKKKKKSAQKKGISPLQKGPASENLSAKKDVKKLSTKTSSAPNVKDSSPGPSSDETTALKDVEMQDVSMDIIDDLAEKKESTVFDTTCYYIIVDTNVLIGELHLINELKDTPLDGCGPPHIFIPWIVIEELDKLKNTRRDSKAALSRNAGEAIRYLNSVLRNHPRFHGQSPAEAEEWAKTYSKCNDDKILECCIALKDKMPPEKVILLTNDKNLVNKALICNINVHNFESMMKKVKPDTTFNCDMTKPNKKQKKERNSKDGQELQKTSVVPAEERSLKSKRDSCKCEIHAIMSNARLLLKNVLSKFFFEEMDEAYGNIWLSFGIETKLLKGLLDGMKKYWRGVFHQFFSEKDKRNFELLSDKATRPEGFLGDKDECLVILSAIEDAFRQIKRRRPNLKVPVEEIQDYRVACVNAFITYSEAESSIRLVEEKSMHDILDRNWNAINQLCGIILDFYGVSHDFNYNQLSQPIPDFEVRRIMTVFYPGVQTFRNLFRSVLDAVQKGKPTKTIIKKLYKALVEFVPSLKLTCDTVSYPFFSQRALESFLTCPQNRQILEIGVKQIEKFYDKLDECLFLMLQPNFTKPSSEETMICD